MEVKPIALLARESDPRRFDRPVAGKDGNPQLLFHDILDAFRKMGDNVNQSLGAIEWDVLFDHVLEDQAQIIPVAYHDVGLKSVEFREVVLDRIGG